MLLYSFCLLSANSFLCVWIVVHYLFIFKLLFYIKKPFLSPIPLQLFPVYFSSFGYCRFVFRQNCWDCPSFFSTEMLQNQRGSSFGRRGNCQQWKKQPKRWYIQGCSGSWILQYGNLKREFLLTKDCPWFFDQALLISGNEYSVRTGLL